MADYFTTAELRAQKNLEDTDKFSDAELDAARTWFETKFENYTGVAWVPRTKTVTLDGSGTNMLVLPVYPVRSVTSVSVYSSAATSTDFTEDELADLGYASGILTRRWGGAFPVGAGNIVVVVEHGYDAPPEDVKQAALVACRDKLLGDQTGNRVYAVQTEDGIVRSSTPGPNTPFGLPFVDEVANRRRVPVLA